MRKTSMLTWSPGDWCGNRQSIEAGAVATSELAAVTIGHANALAARILSAACSGDAYSGRMPAAVVIRRKTA